MVEYERTQDREPTAVQPHKICVVGIGGGGLNVLDRICLDRLMEASLVSMHTDVRVLSHSMAPVKVQLGADLMRGIGCGGDPELGREAAEASREQIKTSLQGHEMVFLCTGLGGGTGSGAAPVVAEIAKELGALVFVFATTPFSFEGRRRITQADVALETLQPYTDALILFENNRMGELILPKEGIQKAFSQADQLIGHSVRAISTMVNQPGIVRVGLADLMSALRSPNSRCLFGFGEARGTNRVQEALKRALKSPLVNQGLLLQNAQNLIVHIAGGETLALAEVDALMKQLGKHVPDQTQIMFGLAVEPKLGDLLSVTLISSLSAKDMALETGTRATERIPTRPSDPARPIAKPAAAEAEPPAKPVHISNGDNGIHTPARPLAGFVAQPELLVMEAEAHAAPAAPAKMVEVTMEELFAPMQASTPAPPTPAPVAPPIPSLLDAFVAPVEESPPPAAPRQQAPRPEPAPAPIAEEDVPFIATPVVESTPPPVAPPVAAAPPVARPARVSVQPQTIVKTSIFSVIDEEDEEEDNSTNWADKYIQPKAQQPAPPQIERREPARQAEPIRQPEPAPVATPVKAPVAQKQASLNLHQDDVGRFKGTDKTIVEGEDLDVPTWMRMRGKVTK